MPSPVTRMPPAPPAQAAAHFAARLAFETDCADVHAALAEGVADFVLVEARGPAAYARGHVPGALNLPHREITEARLAGFPPETLFVAYCAGPHCNAADQAALKLARLGRRVKVMPGGILGWLAEGYPLAEGEEPGRPAA
ncbi:rhodanese-like domain-containing protein [Paracraurococcus ruber]|uniref:rhodanese-like domain-containing protein n=1 Tax=Paracraurococcus ruber TaxID=77675 RepID=UPI001057FF21|nr:rhodanese-like domain-containing protein [Paracraurococcus ruber]TDG27546.1 rhodanese-like domain-containing protein [Paracraurococcus ruber]